MLSTEQSANVDKLMEADDKEAYLKGKGLKMFEDNVPKEYKG